MVSFPEPKVICRALTEAVNKPSNAVKVVTQPINDFNMINASKKKQI
jgi:hypothetical protein